MNGFFVSFNSTTNILSLTKQQALKMKKNASAPQNKGVRRIVTATSATKPPVHGSGLSLSAAGIFLSAFQIAFI